jgi:hypothetical protein
MNTIDITRYNQDPSNAESQHHTRPIPIGRYGVPTGKTLSIVPNGVHVWHAVDLEFEAR